MAGGRMCHVLWVGSGGCLTGWLLMAGLFVIFNRGMAGSCGLRWNWCVLNWLALLAGLFVIYNRGMEGSYGLGWLALLAGLFVSDYGVRDGSFGLGGLAFVVGLLECNTWEWKGHMVWVGWLFWLVSLYPITG